MKAIKNITLKAALLTAVCLCAFTPGKAQMMKQGYLNVDWQLNVPLSNGFADKTSGWGMNFEGGAWVGMSDFALGGFLNYHTNNEYIGPSVLRLAHGDLYTDQQHTIFQLPFGVSGRYRLMDGSGVFDPYISMKLGANFARVTSFYSTFESSDATWGFYLSPEIGTVIYPTYNRYFGFHVAAYFSYGTNKCDLLSYSVNGLSNFGIRLGVSF